MCVGNSGASTVSLVDAAAEHSSAFVFVSLSAPSHHLCAVTTLIGQMERLILLGAGAAVAGARRDGGRHRRVRNSGGGGGGGGDRSASTIGGDKALLRFLNDRSPERRG